MSDSPDIVVIGSGIGAATILSSLAPTKKSILILERGEVLSDSKNARNDSAIFNEGIYRPSEFWLDAKNKAFLPGNYYYVGGNSKFYGAVMFRYREKDFEKMKHMGGVSPKWPISYQQLEPWYQAAEELFEVRGEASNDASEPMHSGKYLFPPIPDESPISDVRERLKALGISVATLPISVDVEKWLKRAKTPWDAFPDTTGAKVDAESILRHKVLPYSNVKLITGAKVNSLITNDKGCITDVDYKTKDGCFSVNPKLVILSAGAVNSAALLLKSASANFPNGLANTSDLVGRNFMNHNCSALLAFNPARKNDSVYQKTLYFNDFYLDGGPNNYPLGNVQLLGKITGNILSAQSKIPSRIANFLASRSIGWYVMSEDLPNKNSRVSVVNNNIKLDWKRSNYDTHKALVKKTKKVLRKIGFPIVLSKGFDRHTPSHQCGTAKFGNNPNTSVLDTYCRSHDHNNLFVVDASFLPTSAAVNPSLTIAAQALRVGNHIKNKDLK